MSQFEAAQTNDDADTPWYVQLPNGEVRTMTLDELVQSFEAGLIDERANVLQMGETEWRTLGEVAGLGEDDDEEGAQVDIDDDGGHQAVNGYANGHSAGNGYAAASASAWPSQQPAAGASWPPVAAPITNGAYGSQAPAAYGARPAATAQYNTIPAQRPIATYDLQTIADARSTAPVAFDMDDDFGPTSFRRKKSRAMPVMATLAVLGGLGFAGFRYAPMLGAANAPVAAAVPPPAPPPPPAADPPPAAQPAAADPPPPTPAATDNRLNDATKQALIDADKKRDAQQKAQQKAMQDKRQQRAADATPHHSGGKHGKAGSPFTKGGDKYDPLNSSL